MDIEVRECLIASQDTERVIMRDDSWDLHIEIDSKCCTKKNATKIFNESIIVTVRDGFKLFGKIPVKTKVWNITIPILTSICICLFVWFSNFSQPRAANASFVSRFYQNTKLNHPDLKQPELSIDKDEEIQKK